MNRTLTNVLFRRPLVGGRRRGGQLWVKAVPKNYKEAMADDVAVMTAYAQRVVIVPGYGLAVAQAQHTIREVASLLEAKGVDVKYGIHPVCRSDAPDT